MVEAARSSVEEERSILVATGEGKSLAALALPTFEARMGIHYIDRLLFEEEWMAEKMAKRCARKLKREKFFQMNRWTLALYGKGMERPLKHFFYIRWINRYLGYGVFAARTLPALTYIGEYTGVVQKRNNRKNRYNDYVFSYDLCGKATRFCIDARERGNFTRFLNHSDQPNLTSRWVIKEGISHIIFFTNRSIPPHAQLTYCYGPWYWRRRSLPSAL